MPAYDRFRLGTAKPSSGGKLDDGWLMDYSVPLIHEADVVNGDTFVVDVPVAIVDVPADHQSRPDPGDRSQQFPAAQMLDPSCAEIEGAVPNPVGRLVRYQDVHASRNPGVHGFERLGCLHERPLHELIGPRCRPHRDGLVSHGDSCLLVDEDLKAGRCLSRSVAVKAACLATPGVIAPGQELVGGGYLGKPRSHMSIEPRSLLLGGVHRPKGPESIRAHIARDDQEVARGDVRQVAVLIAERDDSHW